LKLNNFLLALSLWEC